jgi:hypothetical protein
VPLEELEIHLREDIEQQMKEELNVQRAFGEAIQQIGPPNAHQKADALTVEQKRPVAIAAGVLTVFGGFILVLASLVQSRDRGK